MIVFGSMYIQTNESLTLKSIWSTFCLLQKNCIQNIANLINYNLNIVKNVIVIDLFLKNVNKKSKRLFTK